MTSPTGSALYPAHVEVLDSEETPEKPAPDLSTRRQLQARAAARAPRRRRLSAATVRRARIALAELHGTRHLDRRSWQARFLEKVEHDLVTALGGFDAVSEQQAIICRMAARTAFLLEQVDQFLQDPDGLPSPINRGKRALFPIVVQRQSLADALLRQLQAIGYERRAKPVKSLAEYLAEESEESPPPEPSAARALTGEVQSAARADEGST